MLMAAFPLAFKGTHAARGDGGGGGRVKDRHLEIKETYSGNNRKSTSATAFRGLVAVSSTLIPTRSRLLPRAPSLSQRGE